MINYISVLTVPLIVTLIIVNGLLRKSPVFDLFTDGAKDGITTSIKLLPSLIGLIVAVSMLRASGFFDAMESIIAPLLHKIGFPGELVPMALIRPISGSASLALVRDILNTYGPDSFIGKCASVMMGSTETTFYTLAVYFGYVKIKNSRYTVKAALLADATGIIVSVLAVRLLFH